MTGTTLATAGARLPEDVILEILSRLEEASALFRCAATCRRWRSLVADPSLLRPLWPVRSFVRFFTNEWRRGEGVSFVPGPRSALGAGRRFLGTYLPYDPGLSDWVLPLASHHGVLLVRLFPRDSHTMQLAVCDPLAGKWDVLPTLRINEATDFVGYAVVISSVSFTVLLIMTENNGQVYFLDNFSSVWRRWTVPMKLPDNVEHILRRATIVHTDAVMCRGGIAYLLAVNSKKLHILSVDSQTGHAASRQVLIPGNRHERIRLTTTVDEVMLSLCTYDGGRFVEISGQQYTSEDVNLSWLCTKVLKLELHLPGSRCMCLGARSDRLLLMDCHQHVYVLDLKSGEMEEIVAIVGALVDLLRTSNHSNNDDTEIW